jgi:DNA-binding CsgD family transcriptional regulator
MVSTDRRPDQGLSRRDELASKRRFTAKLRAAGELAVRVGLDSTRRMVEALAAAGHPVALIGRDGCVIQMNVRFERLIGNGVCVKAGRLGSWQADADSALAAAVERATRSDGVLREPLAVVLPRREGRRPLVAQVVPMAGRAHDVPHPVAAIVTVTDLAAASSGPPEHVLQQAFGLTPAEARLAKQIAAGKTLADISQQCGGARGTLRTQLKSIFDKTGTGRQTELALLLAKMTPPAD